MDPHGSNFTQFPLIETTHAKAGLEMPVADLNVSTWCKIVSEAKNSGLSEIPITGTHKVSVLIGSWPASMETPVGSDVKEKFLQNFPQIVKDLEYDFTQDLPGQVYLDPANYDLGPMPGPGPILLGDTSVYQGSDSSQKEHGYDHPQEFQPRGTSTYYIDDTDRTSMVSALRGDLKFHERLFKRQYIYGTDSPIPFSDLRVCFTKDNAFAWKEEMSGITWVGLRSGDDICVVTFNDLNRGRLQGYFKSFDTKTILSMFRKCVLSELEDLADPSSKLCDKLHRSIDDVPFCVVSSPWHHEPMDPFALDLSRLAHKRGLLLKANDSAGVIDAALDILALEVYYVPRSTVEVTLVSGLKNGLPAIREFDYEESRQFIREYRACHQESM